MHSAFMDNAITRGASYISFTGAIVRVTHIFRTTVKFTFTANGRTIKHEWPFDAFLTRYKPL
jgi:hypothetical protein